MVVSFRQFFCLLVHLNDYHLELANYCIRKLSFNDQCQNRYHGFTTNEEQVLMRINRVKDFFFELQISHVPLIIFLFLISVLLSIFAVFVLILHLMQ